MKRLIANWLLSAICLYILSLLFSGIQIVDPSAALIAAVVLGFVNAIVKPFLHIISLPITILTLGLFSLVINALMLMLASALVPGFYISGFGTAFLAAIVMSFLNTLLITRR